MWRTTSGWRRPWRRIESASRPSASSSKWRRGCSGVGTISWIATLSSLGAAAGGGGARLRAGPAESRATERSKTDAAGGPARARPPASPAPVGWAADASGGGSLHALRPQTPADGHALDPPDEARVHAVHRPRELHLVQPRHEPLEDLLQLEAGAGLAAAEVDAHA